MEKAAEAAIRNSSARFPTPALPGSGTKGRGIHRSQSKLPQLFVKLDYCRSAVNPILDTEVPISSNIFSRSERVTLNLWYISGIVQFTETSILNTVAGDPL